MHIPTRSETLFERCIASQSVKHLIGVESLDEVGEPVEISLGVENLEFAGAPLLLEDGATKHHQVVHLDS